MIKIAIMGHGVVGSGVMEVLQSNKAGIENKAKEEIEVKYILDLRDFDELPYKDKFVKDFNIILNDPEVTLVVETMGGLNPAYEYTKQLLEKGKSVVTSNKEVVASKGGELLNLAKRNNLNYLFEASVGGGIPIIRPISQCLVANRLDSISGILNGTTNYILTKMLKDNNTFEEALAKAQQKGFAEKDPSADIDGVDTCRKISILASLCFGKHIYPNTVYTEGIRNVTIDDVIALNQTGMTLKLIGSATKLPSGKISILVAPFAVSSESPLHNVEGVFNGILVHGDAIGDVMFYGKGAGKLPTASAVVADIVDEVKHIKARKYLSWAETDSREMDTIIEDIGCAQFQYIVISKISLNSEQFNRISENLYMTQKLSENEAKNLFDKLGQIKYYRYLE